MKVPENFEPVSDSFTEDNHKERLAWVTSDSEITYYPEFFRTELSCPKHYVQHIITDGRKN